MTHEFEYNFEDKQFIVEFKSKIDNYISKCEHNWIHCHLNETGIFWSTLALECPEGVSQCGGIKIDGSGQFLVFELYCDIEDGAYGMEFTYATDDLGEAMKLLVERIKKFQRETKEFYDELSK